MEDSTFKHQFGSMQSLGDSLDEFDFACEKYSSCPSSSPKNSNPYLSYSTFENFQTGEVEKPAKQLKTEASSSSSCLISFGKSESNPITNDTQPFYGNINWNGNMNLESVVSREYSYPNQEYYSQTYGQGTRRLPLTRDPLQNQEHLLAERKRREKLNMLFISLSAIIPGLTKVLSLDYVSFNFFIFYLSPRR